MKTVNFDVCKKPPKLIGYHNKFFGLPQKLCTIIPIHMSTNSENLVKIGAVLSEIAYLVKYAMFCDIVSKSSNFSPLVISGVTGPKFIKCVQDVEGLLAL